MASLSPDSVVALFTALAVTTDDIFALIAEELASERLASISATVR